MRYLLLISLCILGLSTSRLVVVKPQELIEKIQQVPNNANATIPYELANFGKVDYGTIIFGRVGVSDPYDACSIPENQTENLGEQVTYPFLLVQRGKCAFAQKVLNAQKQNAQVVIVVNDREDYGKVVMIDNGRGDRVHITSVFIDKKYGDVIKTFMEENKNTEVLFQLQVTQKKASESQVRFWISLNSRKSSLMITKFNRSRSKLSENKVFTEPIYDIFEDKYGADQSNCVQYKGVTFCAQDPDLPFVPDSIPNRDNIATGRDVVEEVVRQLCVHRQDEGLWWQYQESFNTYCIAPQNFEECSEAYVIPSLKNFNQDQYKNCLKSESTIRDMLQYQVDQTKKYSIYEWPAVTINENLFRGNLEEYNMIEAVCDSLESPQGECRKILGLEASNPDEISNNDSKNEGGSSSPSIFMILLIVLLAFVALFFIMTFVYKRVVRREISADMSQQVNQMVSQYIAFYESRGKTGDNSESV